MHFTLDTIPAGLGGWDSPATQRALATSQREREEDAAERSARCEELEHDIHRTIACCDADTVLQCVPAGARRQPLTLARALYEAADHDDLDTQLMQLLMDAAAGHQVTAHANDLLRKLVAVFADGEVDR